MLPDDLLKTARLLIDSKSNRPRQSDLRRAISTIYYAMFHTLAKCCADLLVGSIGAQRSEKAWEQVYRTLEHGVAKSACKHTEKIIKFPTEIQDFANRFLDMQEKRHKADYHPYEKVYKSAVVVDLNLAELSIRRFNKAHIRDRRAFAVLVLLKPPRL